MLTDDEHTPEAPATELKTGAICLNYRMVNDIDEATLSNYEKMVPPIEHLKSHAFSSLKGPGSIERYDVYCHVKSRTSNNLSSGPSASTNSNSSSVENGRELAMARIQIGKNLNGHDGIVHGGIITLLFDETFGWGVYDYLARTLNKKYGDDDFPLVVTANLSVEFRSPLPAEIDAVIRVYHEKTEGRKIYLNGRMESSDGSMLYSESSALFIKMKQKT